MGLREIILTWEGFGSRRDKPRTKKTGRRITRSYTAPGAGLAQDCPGLRGREKPVLYQTRESREADRDKDDSESLDERRCSRARGTDVSFGDVTIKIPDSGYDQGCE